MTMFQYDFMINAFMAAGIVAVVSGFVGFFLVMRGQTFAGHALSHIGFAGATGAGLIDLAPIWGLLGFTLVAGIGMGLLGQRITGRDVAIGVVLALALGFGLLFLHYYTSFAHQATAILFGNVLAVDRSTIKILAALAVYAGRTRRNHASAHLRNLAAGISRGEKRADALRLYGILGYCRANCL
jgi:zinc/manganese transport system permease protein